MAVVKVYCRHLLFVLLMCTSVYGKYMIHAFEHMMLIADASGHDIF